MKRKGILLFIAKVRAVLIVASGFIPKLDAADIRLGSPVPQQDGSMTVNVTGIVPGSVAVQGSTDLRTWTDLQTLSLQGSANFREPQASETAFRFFRVKNQSPPPALPDLSASVNTVFPAGESFNSVQFAPNGNLGFIFWKNSDLVLRERRGGSWFEERISGGGASYQTGFIRGDGRFVQPGAVLLYDSGSAPHVFKLNGDKTVSHLTRGNGGNGAWSETERITNAQASAGLNLLVASTGPGGVFHLAAISGGDYPNLTYGSNKGGNWVWTSVTSVGAFPRNYLAPSYAPRWFSMAVDSLNAAHIVYRPAFNFTFNGEYIRVHNDLAIASNVSGNWRVETVESPADVSGEAGNGASVAIGKDDKPYIASWYNERGDGGSAQWSRLHFHSRGADGRWTSSVVTSRPDGYIAGDGEKGTGFAPYLRFDPAGRPNIIFTDHGSEHFWMSGQSEYAGQIRHARLNGGTWEIQTVYRQSDPKKRQVLYPAFAVSDRELIVTGVERETDWNMSVYPPLVNSNYRFVTVQKGL